MRREARWTWTIIAVVSLTGAVSSAARNDDGLLVALGIGLLGAVVGGGLLAAFVDLIYDPSDETPDQ